MANRQPEEPFTSHQGGAGGAPYELTSAWTNSPPKVQPPGAQSPSTENRCGGLASRYGLVVWWKANSLHVWPGPKPGEYWPTGAPRTFEAVEPLVDGEVFPAREALRLAHGHAYMLGKSRAARVSLGRATEKALPLTLRQPVSMATPLEDEASISWSSDVTEENLPMAVSSQPSRAQTAPPSQWEIHQVEWIAQNDTSSSWLGLGIADDSLVGVKVRGSSALFEGEMWVLPPSVSHSNWRELLVWDDAPTLRSSEAIWREENGVWQQKFQLGRTTESLDGAFADAQHLWVWGREDNLFWVARLNDEGRIERASMPWAHNDHLFPFPTIHGTQITFFQSGSRSGACTLDVARPLNDAMRQEFPAAMQVIWATAVSYKASDEVWLLYAADDGEIVSLYQMQQKPYAIAPFMVARFRPLRDAHDKVLGATLAMTICGEALVTSYIGTRKGELGVWLTAHTWSPLQNVATSMAPSG